MTQKLYKHKLLLDENFPPHTRLPKLNGLYDVKHIALDLHNAGMKYLPVYELACQENRLLVTRNYPDFRSLPKSTDTGGAISISGNLTYSQIDTKLVSFLRKSNPKSLYGKASYISGETRT
jgi:hypothetical protein